MSMSLGSESGEEQPMMEINTTPLIDVMLVLLIVLIISIPPMTQAVNLDMPTGKNTPPITLPEVIDLEIDFDGTYLWNGTVVPDMATLESYFRQESGKPVQPELHVRPNRRVKYEYVAQALASAQRSHMARIGFVGNEQFMD